MTWRLEDLPWLPPAPADFRERCKAVRSGGDDPALELQNLAGYRLNGNQLQHLASVAESCGALGALPARFRLGVLSNATTDLLVPALKASALRYGVALEIEVAPFNQVAQTAFDPGHPFHLTDKDAVLVALDRNGLSLSDGADAALSHALAIGEALKRHGAATVIYQTMPRGPTSLYGSLDLRQPGTERAELDRYNRLLADALARGTDLLLDTAALAESVGLATWHNPGQWHMARLPFSQALVPLYADHLARLIGALRGRSRKCLVLDLDNTLWGGVIGDDGLAGIRLGGGDAVGEAFLAVQETAIRLRERGIVLAVCSKNDEAVAREPFRSHESMLLREEHIAAFVANWTDKAANIHALAEVLDLGLDAFVLLDDNPVERAQVRGRLPQVAVPELPDDPALYPLALLSAGYFEAALVSPEDRSRADQYRANAQRKELQAQANDLGAFLHSLEMKATIRPFDAVGRSRIAQLIARSNQFNLTTRRYSEAEVAAMEAAPDCHTYQISLADRFGDNGMISVVICRDDGDAWEIDTWLMSCRVLGRQVEQAVLDRVAADAGAAGKRRLVGRYVPSKRNDLVREHYARLGFTLLAEEGSETVWSLSLEGRAPLSPPILVG